MAPCEPSLSSRDCGDGGLSRTGNQGIDMIAALVCWPSVIRCTVPVISVQSASFSANQWLPDALRASGVLPLNRASELGHGLSQIQ